MSSKTRRNKREQERKKKKELTPYSLRLSCGCCYEIGYFKDMESVSHAYTTAGLGSSMTVKDDLGHLIKRVDTFYPPEVR